MISSSLQRKQTVYREVCSACHSLDRIAWRNLVGVSHTVDEVKAMAEEVEYTDGPNDQGEMFQRPLVFDSFFASKDRLVPSLRSFHDDRS